MAKYKPRSRKPWEGSEDGERTVVFGISQSTLCSIAGKYFELWFYCCRKLYLAPFTRTAAGEYVPVDRKSKLIHYLVWSIVSLMFLHKLGGLGTMLYQAEELKLEIFIGTSQVLIYLLSFCFSLVMITKPSETMDVLNSWPSILSCLKEVRGTEGAPSQFDNLSGALYIIGGCMIGQRIPSMATLSNLAFSALPTCYFGTAEVLGWVPKALLLLPRLAWRGC